MKVKFPQRILIIGGTGSLGTTLTARLLKTHNAIAIFSRDEAKQYYHKNKFYNAYCEKQWLQYFIGDIRDYDSILAALWEFRPQIIINAAAMKQVPLCEQFPGEAVKTNVLGTENLCKAALAYARQTVKYSNNPLIVLSVSTDKAVKSVNAYGATKALQEKIHLTYDDGYFLRCNCVRYGNVLNSTGSVIPYFQSLLAENKKLPVTSEQMTRFLLSLDDAIDLINTALDSSTGGQIFVPSMRSAKIIDLAHILCMDAGVNPKETITFSGIRPGEKLHEILISEEECNNGVTSEKRDGKSCYVIDSIYKDNNLSEHYFSSDYAGHLLSGIGLAKFLNQKGVIKCIPSQLLGQTASSDATLSST